MFTSNMHKYSLTTSLSQRNSVSHRRISRNPSPRHNSNDTSDATTLSGSPSPIMPRRDGSRSVKSGATISSNRFNDDSQYLDADLLGAEDEEQNEADTDLLKPSSDLWWNDDPTRPDPGVEREYRSSKTNEISEKRLVIAIDYGTTFTGELTTLLVAHVIWKDPG